MSSTPGAPPPPSLTRWQRAVENGIWIQLTVTVVAVALYDLVALIAANTISNIFATGDGLATQLHQTRQGMVVIPILLAVPVVIAFGVRRGRVAITVIQLLLCSVLLVQSAHLASRTSARLHGTATCWSNLYSNADCPWGDKS